MKSGVFSPGISLAWHYKQYYKDTDLAALELEARKKKIGLWSQPNPVALWDFRRK